MGISTGGGGKGRQRSEINVTPLVDVVLVLLIIFLVTMPIMMKQVTLEVPRKLDDQTEQAPVGKQLTILLKNNGDVIVSDGEKDQPPLRLVDLAAALRPQIAELKNEKIVFVDYCDAVLWRDVVSTMDQVRAIATDKDHDEVKVALKMREKKQDGSVAVDSIGCPCDPTVAGDDPHSCAK